jgi:hypothetical protein
VSLSIFLSLSSNHVFQHQISGESSSPATTNSTRATGEVDLIEVLPTSRQPSSIDLITSPLPIVLGYYIGSLLDCVFSNTHTLTYTLYSIYYIAIWLSILATAYSSSSLFYIIIIFYILAVAAAYLKNPLGWFGVYYR